LHSWPDNGCPLLYFVLQYRAVTEDPDAEWVLGEFCDAHYKVKTISPVYSIRCISLIYYDYKIFSTGFLA